MQQLVAPYEDKIAHLRELFEIHFGTPPSDESLIFASAPGRVELAGNHTDHQGGRVISAAIDLRSYALASPNKTSTIRLFMEGFGFAELDLSDNQALEPHAEERTTSLSLVRGMAAQYAQRGNALAGFDMVTTSDIPSGAGLSSSAAFEMLVGRTLEALFSKVAFNPIALALEGMHTEREYFGKPCGAQDQIASALGGAVAMDFSEEPPSARALAFEAANLGHALCLIDSRCDHSLYNDEFASIPDDMHRVAQLFGCERLGGVNPAAFLESLEYVRTRLGDGIVLRALHYFDETLRVASQEEALETEDFAAFLSHVRLSGASSAQYLQNVSPRGDGNGVEQPAMVILALCAHLLENTGAWRIHGGGFGGSVLAFVPEADIDTFIHSMNSLLGYDACRTLHIDSQGAFAVHLGTAKPSS